MKHSVDCNGYHTTCEKCGDDILEICCNEFGAPQYCSLHEEEEMSNIEIIKQDKVYQKIMKDSFGGILYDVANKYDAAETIALWDNASPAERESAGGIMSGAFNFLKEQL